jgi:hypothetical protein
LITLQPGRRNEFVDWQIAKVCITVLAVMDVKIQLNLTLELLEQANQSSEFTSEWLMYPKHNYYWPFFTKQD